ncbi:relaxase/mobilization nuclease domain-containing protein [Nostoc sp. 'Peltigera membranacea cyanobiont' N6]|uniref:relaxase/mobilization nuclease domain-containing protein n=1 Tax=Nostoc sp. 'Peltigera membranacea cyanobiont' N6 TaxID=1261031 RepID=UPI000D0C040F|nr:relaxase/mobilization nuclease domain-containing protein [Nostoc sp. 'Peltigera membranacea cyanobiont' N6]AVH68573.1 relaxase/mobilization protein [Nostoc sp. 'Peltigera membranacea cyanobiont' N6]
MIGNQTKGKSFRGLLDYLSNKEQSSLIGGNMFGTNARELAREFRLSRQLNPEAEKVVHHVSLSLSPGEQLDNDTWCLVADKYIEEMGYTANQYAIYRHSDRNHDHIHICASRISLDDGKITRDSWEYVRSEKIIRQLELEYGLQQTLNSKEKLSRAPSYGQQRRIEREQLEYELGLRNTPPQQSIKTQLIELIDRAIVDKPTMPQLVERLQLQGVEVRHGLTRNGKSKGISYSWNDQKFSGTSLGPAYTFPGLQKHKGIDYQPQRDDERIENLLKNPKQQAVESQRFINTISDFIEQSVVDDALVETLPQLTEQLSGYQQQLANNKTTFDDLETAIVNEDQRLSSQKAVDAISDFIEQSVVDDALAETLPQLTEQLSQYRQQLEAGKTAFDDLGAAIVNEDQRLSSQRAVDAISDFIEQSVVDDALAETLPQLTEQLSIYRQQLFRAKTAFNDFETALTTELQSHADQKAILSISDYIEQSAIESALTETVLGLTEQLSQYRQQLLGAKTAFNDFETALTTELQSHADQKAILSIFDYIEQSTVSSALTETVLELTQQLSQNQQQLSAGRTIFDDLEAAIVYLEQLHRSQTTVDAIALNKTPTITTDEPKLKDNLSAELYEYYSADLQNLLVTDRDKEIAIRALLDNKPSEEVEEIIFASPAGWTTNEARELVLIANNQLAHLQEQPQFTPPEEDESKRRVLHYYLTQQRALTNFLVQPLQRQGLAYIDQQAQVVFIKRDLDGEKSGALVWDTARFDNRCTEYPENSDGLRPAGGDRSPGWFHLKLGGEADDKIERVFLCDSPIDALTMAEIDRNGNKGQPPVRTMYMAVDSPDNLPFEVLRNISRIGLAFNNDDLGNEAAQVVKSMLPQAKRIAPKGQSWNEVFVRERRQQQEMLEQKQRSRGFSR